MSWRHAQVDSTKVKVGQHLLERGQQGRDELARPAPSCPKVHQHWPVCLHEQQPESEKAQHQCTPTQLEHRWQHMLPKAPASKLGKAPGVHQTRVNSVVDTKLPLCCLHSSRQQLMRASAHLQDLRLKGVLSNVQQRDGPLSCKSCAAAGPAPQQQRCPAPPTKSTQVQAPHRSAAVN